MVKKSKIMIFLVFIILLIISLCYYLHSVLNKSLIANEKIYEISNSDDKNNNNETIINYKEKIDNLKKEYNNNDIVGIIYIENTPFYEMIVQTIDNDYYLNHSIYKNYDKKGQTFLDYRTNINDSKKLIIYGHNAPYNQTPFKLLENYQDSNYLEEHKYIYLEIDNEIKKYEIFSVYIEISDWSYFLNINFDNSDDYYAHLLKLKNKSLYETNVNITKDDNILILQTCSYDSNYKDYEDKFLLVIAKQIEVSVKSFGVNF